MSQSFKTIQSSKISKGHKTYGPRTTVLHLCPDLNPDETARETVDLAILTQRSGWRAIIASGGGTLVNDSERAAVRHHRIPFHQQGIFAHWRKRVLLENLIQKERPALLHAHGIDVLPYAYTIARLHHIPLIADLTQFFDDTPQRQRLLTNVMAISSLIRVPSAFMGDYLYKTYHIAAERLHHVPPGIDLRWYNAGTISPERMQALSRLWRLPELASVILIPMPFTVGGGHKTFLEALARLKDENIFAVLLGNSPNHQPLIDFNIEDSVRELGLEGKVIVQEFCTDWPTACWLSSVIVTPNERPRGQSMPLLAAQAIGRPVIITDCGANIEMVRKDETAWIVPPHNALLLSDVLREAIHLSTDQRLTLADNTRHFVAETFPQAQWFNEMIELYETLLAQHAPIARLA